MTETTSQIPHIKVSSPFVQKYTASELALLNKHKDGYLKAEGPAGRKQYFKAFIWPEMFTYWHQQKGEIIRDQANAIAKDLASWVHNTWRPKSKGSGLVIHCTKAQYVWEYMNDEVWKEISKLLGVEKADPHTPQWFGKLTAAISQILACMSQRELEEMEGAIARIEVEGHSEDVRHRNAERHCTDRLDTSAKANWLDMGALSLSFVTYSTPTGQLAVELHETAAELVGVQFDSFDERHPDKVAEIQRLWLEYVQDITDKNNGVQSNKASIARNSVLPTTPEGYPYLPAEITPSDLNKKSAVHLMRQYLRQNYFLAMGRQSNQVPYSEFDKGARVRNKYVDPQYLPKDFALTDPHNHKVDQIKEFLEFIQKHQLIVPYADVFRFGRVKSTRKNGEVKRTYYPNEIDQNNPPEFKKKVPKKMAARNKTDKHKPDFVSVENGVNADAERHRSLAAATDMPVPVQPMATSLINFNGKIVDFTPSGGNQGNNAANTNDSTNLNAAYNQVHHLHNEFNPNMNGGTQQNTHSHEKINPNLGVDGLSGFENNGSYSGHIQNTLGMQTYSDLTQVPVNLINTLAMQPLPNPDPSRTMQYQGAPTYADPNHLSENLTNNPGMQNMPNINEDRNIQYQAAPNYCDQSHLSGNLTNIPGMQHMPNTHKSRNMPYHGADEFSGYVATNETLNFEHDGGISRRLFLPPDVVGSNQANDLQEMRLISTDNSDRHIDSSAHPAPDFNFPTTIVGGRCGFVSQIANSDYLQQAICAPTVSIPHTNTQFTAQTVQSDINPGHLGKETHADNRQRINKPRPKRTIRRADDLAIQEAEVVVGKRARKVKVRE